MKAVGRIVTRSVGWGRKLAALSVLGMLLGAQPGWGKGAKAAPAEPDYTKGEKPVTTDCPWNLGPTGAFGNIWGTKGEEPTEKSRMIQIHSVVKGTPADSVLQPGDVILGVISPYAGGSRKADARFTRDCRHALAEAITEAENEKNGGQLVLNVWRAGKTAPAMLRLPVKGTFSETAPYECAKTKVLIEEAARSIVKRGFFDGKGGGPNGSIWAFTDALGLLATAEEKYQPLLQEYARAIAKQSEEYDIHAEDKGIGTWHAAYRNLFQTEYHLATKDETVLPGIKALSTYLALGQSGVGTWSHGMAEVKANGLYGPPCAYGAMNSCSVPCAMSLILAQKCGIREEAIDKAVVRSLNFYRWFADKGNVPYGDHPPALNHDNNGKNSMTAVLFDIAGEKTTAEFFTRSTLASYNRRETGHTGHFFSDVWGALGAARGGPEAAQSFIRNMRWYTELERRPDGGSVYQFQFPDDPHKYKGWTTTGCRLMQHCFPRKAIHLTGKGGCLPPITGEDLKATVAAATYVPSKRSATELLLDLDSWSPVVREQAAEALGQRDDNVVKELIAMLDSPNRYARYGACRGLNHAGRGSVEAVKALIAKVEKAEDLTQRYFAVMSLAIPKGPGSGKGLGKSVVQATNALLKQAATDEPVQDPMHKLHYAIAGILFSSSRTADYKGYFPDGQGIETLDRSLLIPAVKSLLTNPNGGARSTTSSVYSHLKEEDLEQLYGDIYRAAKNKAPSGVMFSGGVRHNGMLLLSRKKFQEAFPLALDYLYQDGWGKFGRVPVALEALSNYGSAAKPHLEEMRTREYEPYMKGRKPGEVKKCQEAWQMILDNLERPVETESIAPYLKEERSQ